MKKKRDKIRDHSAEKNLFLRRTFVALLGIIALTSVLLVTLAHLQISLFSYYSTRSNANRIKVISLPPNRGTIYDRNGIPLATNNTVYQLEIVPEKSQNLMAQLAELKHIVGLTEEEIQDFQSERRNYRPYSSVPLKNKLTNKQIARFVVNQHRFPAVTITGKQHRYYPFNTTLAHILGYVSKINDRDKAKLLEENRFNDYIGTSNIGKLGIERYYEDILHGSSGYQEVEVNSRGRIVRQLDKNPPKVGEDIYLTVDLKLQQYIEKLIAGRRAAIVAIDPSNGEILAMVSSPSYDPNLFVDGISASKYSKLLLDKNKPLFNRTIQGSYPPASTVKPFIAIAALAENVIHPNSSIYDIGWWQLPNTDKRYRDWKRWGHGQVNVIRSIESSVDTFYYQIAYNLGLDKISEWMKQFGYGERTGIDIASSEESRGIMPTKSWKLQRYNQPWLQGDTIPIGIGQGYWTATPLQMAKALTILINNGQIYTPHLLLNTHSTQYITSLPINNYMQMISPRLQSVPPHYWQIAKEGMRRVISGTFGTARNIFMNIPYQAAGKSGTAQVYGLKAGEIYDNENISEHLRDHALFIAYTPYDKPKIALAIVLENSGSGSSRGGIIARHILDYYQLNDKSMTTDTSVLLKTQSN